MNELTKCFYGLYTNQYMRMYALVTIPNVDGASAEHHRPLCTNTTLTFIIRISFHSAFDKERTDRHLYGSNLWCLWRCFFRTLSIFARTSDVNKLWIWPIKRIKHYAFQPKYIIEFVFAIKAVVFHSDAIRREIKAPPHISRFFIRSIMTCRKRKNNFAIFICIH